MTGFESFVDVNPWTALFTFCRYADHLCQCENFLFKPVKKMIDDRQQEIDTMYADADAAKQKAADLEKEYQTICKASRMNAIRCCGMQPSAPRSAKRTSSARPAAEAALHPCCSRG